MMIGSKKISIAAMLCTMAITKVASFPGVASWVMPTARNPKITKIK
jgi:hypothetical protein